MYFLVIKSHLSIHTGMTGSLRLLRADTLYSVLNRTTAFWHALILKTIAETPILGGLLCLMRTLGINQFLVTFIMLFYEGKRDGGGGGCKWSDRPNTAGVVSFYGSCSGHHTSFKCTGILLVFVFDQVGSQSIFKYLRLSGMGRRGGGGLGGWLPRTHSWSSTTIHVIVTVWHHTSSQLSFFFGGGGGVSGYYRKKKVHGAYVSCLYNEYIADSQ